MAQFFYSDARFDNTKLIFDQSTHNTEVIRFSSDGAPDNNIDFKVQTQGLLIDAGAAKFWLRNNTSGDGNMFLNARVQHFRDLNGDYHAKFAQDGAVELYYNGSKKFETTNTGIDVTGTANIDNLTINGAQGTDGQVLTSTGSGVAWEDAAGGSSETAERIEVTVKNIHGATLAKGTVVHAAPSATPPSGNVIEVVAADANVAANMPAIGVLNEAILDEGEGQAVMFGAVSGIDTSSFSIGDELYVSTTAGAFTNTKPTATTELIQKIAVVIKSHASNGLIKVFGAGRSNDVPNEIERNVNFTDNSKLTFGDSTTPDLQIYHDGTHSFVKNTTGNLYLLDDGYVEIGSGVELYAGFVKDGAVNLYYDNVKKFETTSTGIEVTGGADTQAVITGTTTAARLDIKTNSHHRFLQTIESDGRFRLYNQTTGSEQFSIASNNNATFAGNVNISKSVGDAVLTIEADTDNNNENDNPRIELKQDGAQIYTHLGINGDADNTFTGAIANYGYLRSNLGLQVVTGGTGLALTISNTQNATFAGDVTVSGGDITLGGTGRIQGVDTVSAGTDAANKTYVDTTVTNKPYLIAVDDRDVKPSDTGIVSGIKAIKPFFGTKGGMTGSNDANYHDILVLDTYSDSSGGGPNAISFDKGNSSGNPEMYIWHGAWNASTWGTGQRVFADNYHPNADKWTTARTLTVNLSGEADGSGSVSWDGSANATLNITNMTVDNGILDDQYVTLDTTQTITGTKTINNLIIGSSAKIQFQNNDYIRYDDTANRFHFDVDGGTSNASVQAATFVGDDIYVGDQIIHNGDTDTYLQFNAGNTWRVVVGGSQKLVVNSNGVNVSNGNVYSPIFYDSDSTTYYLDPASTSYLNHLRVKDDIVGGNLHYDPNTLLAVHENDSTESIRHKLDSTFSGITKVDDSTAPAQGCFQVSGATSPSMFGKYHKIDEGDEFIFEFWIKFVSGTDTDSKIYAGAGFYDANKSYLGNSQRYWGESAVQVDTNSNNSGWYHVTGTLGPNRGTGVGDIPTSAEWMKLLFLFNYQGGDTVTRYCGLHVRRSNPAFTSIMRKTIGSQFDNTTSTKYPNYVPLVDNDGDIHVGHSWGTNQARLRLHGSTANVQSTIFTSNGNLHIDSQTANNIYLQHYSNGWVYMNNAGGHTQSFSSMRAPIFYDSNDTGYYINPQSNTRLSGFVKIGNSSTYNSDDGNWGARMQVASTVHARIDVAQDANSMRSTWYVHTGHSGPMFGTSTAHPLRLMYNGSEVGYWNGTQLHHNSSVRSPIFYDSNDTSYYINPNSTSNFNTTTSWSQSSYLLGITNSSNSTRYGISLYGGAQNGEPTYGLLFTGTSLGTHGSVTGNWATYFTMNNDTTRGWIFRRVGSGNSASISAGGVATFDGSVRTPIFYDSNDTNYYINPNGTSKWVNIDQKGKIGFPASGLGTVSRGSEAYAIYQESGSWSGPSYRDLCIAMHTGISFGANASYGGMRFYTDYQFATQVMSVNNSSDGVGGGNVYVNNTLQAGSSLRAPIFYDTDSTAYYLNPASTSFLSNINFANGAQISFDRGSSDFSTMIYATNHPPAGYTSSGQNYWMAIASKGGTHIILNTDGSYNSSENSYDHFTIWQDNISNYNARQFYVTNVGNVHAKGDVVAYQSSNMSDIRLKKDVKPIENALDIVDKLQGVKFTWKRDDKKSLGFIAQEVEKVVPELVVDRPAMEDPNVLHKTVNYSNMVAILTEAVKELKAEVEELKKQIK